MSIVLHGLGLGDVSTGSSIVAFGLAGDLPEGVPIPEVLSSAGIEQLFVIDYGSQFTRSLTEAEFRRFQTLVKMLLSGPVRFTDQKMNGRPGLKIWKEPIRRAA